MPTNVVAFTPKPRYSPDRIANIRKRIDNLEGIGHQQDREMLLVLLEHTDDIGVAEETLAEIERGAR